MRRLNNTKKKRRRLLNTSRKGDKIECIYIKRLNVIHGHSSRERGSFRSPTRNELRFAPFCIPPL